jgi:hypothetical protein
MTMVTFFSRYHDLGHRETRVLVVRGHESLPDGNYGFIEFYCDEVDCDCRCVLLEVLREEDSEEKTWATITYGWERPSFYARWAHFDSERAAREMSRASLDPLNPQTRYAFALLGLFQSHLVPDKQYVARLRRHYRMFKRALVAAP